MITETKLPRVLYCNVTECAYNEQHACHAAAITVDGPEPLCDTYFHNTIKGGIQEQNGTVGACKNEDCIHNELFECHASNGINVSMHVDKPECDTFTPRTA